MPDRALRQFGYVQGVPSPRIKPIVEERPHNGTLRLQFSSDDDMWLRRREVASMISLQGRPRARTPWQVSSDYMDWFTAHGHPFVLSTSMTRVPPVLPPIHLIDARVCKLTPSTIYYIVDTVITYYLTLLLFF